MTNLLDTKISACREAMQKCIERAEKIIELQKQLDEEIRDEHIRDEWGSWGYV